MSSPVFTEAVSSRGATLSGGSWVLEDGGPFTVVFTPGASGVTGNPYVRHRIIWGDGREEASGDLLPVGRAFSYTHHYLSPGSYTVRVVLTNTAGESSDPTGGINPDSVFAVRQKPASDRKRTPVKWSGIALPVRTISQALSLVESAFPEATTTLAITALRDSQSIVVAAVPQPIEQASVVITQDGKLISSGRVMSADANILNLDSALIDSYDPHLSVVTIRRPALTGGVREFVKTSLRPADWGFPRVTDAELVRASLALLFGTRPHERLMRPELGCRIHEQIFEPNDYLGAQITRRYLLDAAIPESRAVMETVTATIKEHEIQINASVRFRAFQDEVFDVALSLSPSGSGG